MDRGLVVGTEQVEEPVDEDTLAAFVKRDSELRKTIQEEFEKEVAETLAKRAEERRKAEEERVSSSDGWFKCGMTKGRIRHPAFLVQGKLEEAKTGEECARSLLEALVSTRTHVETNAFSELHRYKLFSDFCFLTFLARVSYPSLSHPWFKFLP